MKLKRRDFLKSMVPAIWGGKKVVEDLLRGPGEEPEREPEETTQVDTSMGVTASCYPGYPPVPFGAIYYDGQPLDKADVEYIAEEWAKAVREGRSR